MKNVLMTYDFMNYRIFMNKRVALFQRILESFLVSKNDTAVFISRITPCFFREWKKGSRFKSTCTGIRFLLLVPCVWYFHKARLTSDRELILKQIKWLFLCWINLSLTSSATKKLPTINVVDRGSRREGMNYKFAFALLKFQKKGFPLLTKRSTPRWAKNRFIELWTVKW